MTDGLAGQLSTILSTDEVPLWWTHRPFHEPRPTNVIVTYVGTRAPGAPLEVLYGVISDTPADVRSKRFFDFVHEGAVLFSAMFISGGDTRPVDRVYDHFDAVTVDVAGIPARTYDAELPGVDFRVRRIGWCAPVEGGIVCYEYTGAASEWTVDALVTIASQVVVIE